MDATFDKQICTANQTKPTPAQIRQRCQNIRSTWNQRQRAIRRLRAWGITDSATQQKMLQCLQAKPMNGQQGVTYVI